MNEKKPVGRFVIYFIAIYGLFLITSPVGDKIFAEYYRSFGKTFFYSFIDKGAVGFVKIKKPALPKFSTEMRLANREVMNKAIDANKPYQNARVEVSSWYAGYLQVALLFSLIAATPFIGWKRKLVALAFGVLLMHALIWFQLYIQVLYEFDRNEFLQVIHFSPFWQRVMDALHYLFVETMGLRFVIPVFIWILVTFRKNDLNELLKPAAFR
ncbi:MAG: hypothetical protein SH857_01970 [Chitinophagales bacterium]|nr:hypothetical protein [Chitinophagales bacterium]